MTTVSKAKRRTAKKLRAPLLALIAAILAVLLLGISHYGLNKSNLRVERSLRTLPAEQRWKVLCFAMLASEDEYRRGAQLVLDVWGNKCHKFIFFGWKEGITHIPHVKITSQEEEGSSVLGRKAYRCWKYLYQHHLNDFDFFMKGDIDTYMLMNNYFNFVNNLHPDVPLYFGKQLKDSRPPYTRFVAGASATLSRRTLRQLGEAFQSDKQECNAEYWLQQGHADDSMLADCLWLLGVYPLDTRDEHGRERFMIFDVEYMAVDQQLPAGDWYVEMSFNSKTGPGCCSEQAASFHMVELKDFRRPMAFVDGVWKYTA